MFVRLATVDDAVATASVQVESWLQTYRGIVPDSYLQSLAETLDQRRQRHRETIALGESIQLVGCDQAGTVVGWLAAGPGRDERIKAMGYTGEVYTVYLLKAAKGMGLGRSLMQDAFDRLYDQPERS
jgi:L-amino acid N-acyltransferase YncA